MLDGSDEYKTFKYRDISVGYDYNKGKKYHYDNIYTFPYFCSFLIKDYLKWMNLSEEEKQREYEE